MSDNNVSNNEIRNFTKIVSVAAIVIFIVAIYFIMTSTIKEKPIAGRGASIDRSYATEDVGGDFTLTDQDNREFNSSSLRGKISLVYFGFTFCPDICPASLEKITKVVTTLSKYNIDITPVFISIDPSRDSPEFLKKYLHNFSDKFIGLTGNQDQIKRVADMFKVYYALAPNSNAGGASDYLLDHTSLIYVLDKNAKYIKHFHLDSKPEEMIDYLRNQSL